MWWNSRRWLTALRRRRRAILCAVLPLFAFSAAGAPACAAMRAAPEAAAHSPAPHAHHAADAHSHHGHGPAQDTHDSSSTPSHRTCPHCPLAATANADHAVCAAGESPDHGGFMPAKDSVERPPPLLAPNWLLPAARAAPPLIDLPSLPPLALAVPLNIAHCVLLI